MVGQTVGKYRILDRIGRGSMGTVYRAVDNVLNRDVAIKVLNADLNDPAAGRRFRAEAVAVARLNHPGIAKVYDLFEHDGQWLMAMEFVSGETLEGLVGRRGPLTAEEAADLMTQALVALSHAHGMGVIHRDIKPANLMVTDGRLKITDFGIARVAGTEHLTSAGLVMGTPAYMAPEQVVGQDIDARTDIFALGCVMFFLATATLPFKGQTALELVQARLHDYPTPAQTVRHELPLWFGQVVDRALARDPAKRFQTADEFRLAIDRGLAGLPVGSESSSPEAVPPHLMETVLPGAMPVVGDIARPGPYSAAAAEPTVMATAPVAVAAAPGRRSRTLLVFAALAVIAVIAIGVQLFRPSPPTSNPAPVPPAQPESSVEPAPTPTAGLPVLPPATPALTTTPTPSPTLPAPAGSTPAPAAAGGRRGAAAEPPISFDTVKLLKVTGRRGEDVEATLTLGGVTIVVAPRPTGAPIAMPYKALMAATYVKDRDPKVVPNLAGPPAELDLPGGLLRRRPARHWLVLQGQTSYVVLVLSDADVERVLKTLEDRTRVKIDRPGSPR